MVSLGHNELMEFHPLDTPLLPFQSSCLSKAYRDPDLDTAQDIENLPDGSPSAGFYTTDSRMSSP